MQEKTIINHIILIHVIKATRWRIVCAVLVIIPTHFTLFSINYEEH